MNRKFYVSLEAARLLKEKWYNEDTEYAYNEINMQIERIGANANGISDYCSAPTLLEAMDWLESKDLRISVRYDWIECGWYNVITNGLPTIHNITEVETSDNIFYRDRNECMQKAIEKALELL